MEQVPYPREIFASFRSRTVCMYVFRSSLRVYVCESIYIYLSNKECAKPGNSQKAGKDPFVTIIQQLAVVDGVLQDVTKRAVEELSKKVDMVAFRGVS